LRAPRRQADFPHRRAIAAPNDELNGVAHLVELHIHIAEHLGSNALAFAHEAE